MATRDRRILFLQYRNDHKRIKLRSSADLEAGQQLIGSEPVNVTAGPAWTSSVDDINYQISVIQSEMQKLAKYHKDQLLPTFGDDNDSEQMIEILTKKITKLFHVTHNKIIRISQVTKNELATLDPQELPLRKNVQSHLATQLQNLSSQFKKEQKDFLTRLSHQKKPGNNFKIEDDQESGYEITFTQEQLTSIANNSAAIQQRHEEVQQIAKSIHELNQMFKDLSTLVQEQGTILDMIDKNIEETVHYVQTGNKELDNSLTQVKNYRKKLCMLLLCIVILVMVIVCIFKSIPGF
eukprot:TRINITY_DN1880_c0_g1_i1.p1 TRINITY_DN1880_c0_g1~~TRINITY_DN1880_c0_g1_i1.p1  ORF type:complete len:294 (-),score=90.96 TRINITY_DN1880_c0_g1_i1:80-961(-)